MTNEQEVTWANSAIGTAPLTWLGIGLVGLAVLQSGLIGVFLSVVLSWAVQLLLPVLLLALVFSFFRLGRLINGLFALSVKMVTAVIPTRGVRLSPGRAPQPGRQLTLANDAFSAVEVVIASTRRLPAGSALTIYGVRVGLAFHAWLVKTPHGVILARGVFKAIAWSACGLIAVSFLYGGSG